MLPNKVTTKQAELANGDVLTLPCDMNYYFLEDDEKAKLAVEALLPIMQDPNGMVAVDIETSEFDPFKADILLLQIGTTDDIQYIFDIRKINPEIVKPLLEGPCWKVGQNLKFEGSFFKKKWGINLTHMFDTMLAEMVIRGGQGGRRRYGLDQIISDRLGLEMTLTRRDLSEQLISDTGQEAERAKKVLQLSFTKMKPEEPFSLAQLAYAASDVSSTMIIQLARWQMEKLMETGPNALYDNLAAYISDKSIAADYEAMFPRSLSLWATACLEFKFLEVVIDIELAGIRFDVNLHDQVMENVRKDYEEYRVTFLDEMSDGVQQTTLFGTAAINPDSPTQVRASLLEVEIDVEDTEAETLEEVIRTFEEGTKKYAILSALMGYRKASKLITTYGAKLRKKVSNITGRLHYTIKQIVDTGRTSNSNPNLQNIPALIAWKLSGDKEKDQEIRQRKGLRECFIPEDGYVFLIYDYSSQEMRIAAHITRDKNLHKAFKEERDPHSHAAHLMYNVDYEELHKRAKAEEEESRKKLGITLEEHQVAKKQRSEGKTINFASLYGSGAKNISEKLGIPMDQAQALLDRYWEVFPQVEAAMERYGEFAIKQKYTNTIIGRRRYFTDILEKISWVYGCKTPEEITSLIEKLKFNWMLEGTQVTESNMKRFQSKVELRLKGDVERQAGNMTIQGSGADMLKAFSVSLREDLMSRNLDARLVGLVHDEVLIECRENIVDEVDKLARKHMIETQLQMCPTIPAGISGGSSPTWKK